MYLADLDAALAELAIPCGYGPGSQPAIEPTALAALACPDRAASALRWLASQQIDDGSVLSSDRQTTPCWPTAMAILAWSLDRAGFQRPIERGVNWLLSARGKTQRRSHEMGHDTTLVGWPWVLGTHSWIEPTAWSVLALKSAGFSAHPRVREAVRLLVDRLLTGGGCNYGNSFVLGQELRPHLQPTGLVLLALAGETINDRRISASLDYLEHEISAATPCASLCHALWGLAAHHRFPAAAAAWLEAALRKRRLRDWKLALIALAAQGPNSPLHQLPTAV
jgi:hypothetical protein